MTPAEKLAAKKPWRRSPRNHIATRRRVWNCRVRDTRERLRLSLDDAADGIGISKTALWQIEMGSDPMLTTASAIATFFGMEVKDLWPKRG